MFNRRTLAIIKRELKSKLLAELLFL